VSRREFIRFDRHRLEYLDPIQKLGCWYCGYANGLLHYASRIAAQTEEIFCPIQHQPGGGFHPPAHHADFAPYGGPGGVRSTLGDMARPVGRIPPPLTSTAAGLFMGASTQLVLSRECLQAVCENLDHQTERRTTYEERQAVSLAERAVPAHRPGVAGAVDGGSGELDFG